jgi:hypothetical protein
LVPRKKARTMMINSHYPDEAVPPRRVMTFCSKPLTISLNARPSAMGPELFHPLRKASSFFLLNSSRLFAMDFHRNSFCSTWRSGAVRSVSVSKDFPFSVVIIIGYHGRALEGPDHGRDVNGIGGRISRKKRANPKPRKRPHPFCSPKIKRGRGLRVIRRVYPPPLPAPGRVTGKPGPGSENGGSSLIRPRVSAAHRPFRRSRGPCVPTLWP